MVSISGIAHTTLLCVVILLSATSSFADDIATPLCSHNNPTAQYTPSSTTFSWRIDSGTTLRFWVPEDVNYEAIITTIKGKVLCRSQGAGEKAGWREFQIPTQSVFGDACILRIKLGTQLVVAGKVLWPQPKA